MLYAIAILLFAAADVAFAQTGGLPQSDAFETVLRDAMAVDAASPAGVYFGTRNGKLFGSADEGETWTALADGLPPVVAVKTAVI